MPSPEPYGPAVAAVRLLTPSYLQQLNRLLEAEPSAPRYFQLDTLSPVLITGARVSPQRGLGPEEAQDFLLLEVLRDPKTHTIWLNLPLGRNPAQWYFELRDQLLDLDLHPTLAVGTHFVWCGTAEPRLLLRPWEPPHWTSGYR